MYYVDPVVIRAAMDLRRRETELDADSVRSSQPAACPCPEAQQQRWLPHHRSRLLRQVGRRLVVLGERLERCGMPESMSVEGQVGASG
jgi:hypothetical protein